MQMQSILEKIKCSGCGACAAACPKNCINMKADEEGFLYPVINENDCINCGLCKKVCPVISGLKSRDNKPVAFAAINNDEKIRLESSSGGIFTLLAQKVLENGGVVFGAAFNNDFEVEHVAVNNVEDLDKLRGSKYTQSRIGNTYKKAKEYLDNGTQVLFTGTPCQISGLKSYLNKEYENLITQDLICHGAPSPLVWKEYINYRSNLAGASVDKISFRNKDKSWKNYSLAMRFANDTQYSCQVGSDPFMRVFLENLCLRPSCYSCMHDGDNRVADITLADFWGVWDIDKDFYDDKGTSLVIINTQKGQEIFDSINSNMVIKQVDFNNAIKYNPCYNTSVKMPKTRYKFMKNFSKDLFGGGYKKYIKVPFKLKIRRGLSKIKRMIIRSK